MSIERASFSRSALTEHEKSELRGVTALADQLYHFMVQRSADINAVHIHNARSGAVQEIISELLKARLGFGEEVVIPPHLGLVTRARPDFYYELSPGRGVIAEVERGGTTTNNHDLKDMWKAHISPNAQHLFLIVPVSNWQASGLPRERPFRTVSRRLGAFFGDQRREVDVVSVHLFGYGGNLLRASDIDYQYGTTQYTPEVTTESNATSPSFEKSGR